MNQAIEPAVLISSHDTLDGLFVRLVAAARRGDWLNAVMVGESFAIALDVHLRHEELTEFPRYEATSPEAGAEVAAFLDEHAQIRRAIGRLLAQTTARQLDEHAVECVGEMLRTHDAHESLRFQPWLERQRHARQASGGAKPARSSHARKSGGQRAEMVHAANSRRR